MVFQKMESFFFKDENNQLTGFYSMNMDHSNGRVEGESYCIKLISSNMKFHGRELILGISKNPFDNGEFYAEIYNLDNINFTKYLTIDIFGSIVTDSFTILKNPDESDSNFDYTFVYIVKKDSEYKLYLKKTYFSFELPGGYEHVINEERNVEISGSVSSFYT